MTHGEIRGTLILLALMALVICATYLARLPKGESAPAKGSPAPPSQCATSPRLAEGPMTRRQLDSMNLEDAAARQTTRDSIAHAVRPAEKKAHSPGANKTGKPVTNKPSRSHYPAPSPLDRPL